MLKHTGKNHPTKWRRLMEELFGDDKEMDNEEEEDSFKEYKSDKSDEELSRPQHQPNKERNHVEGHKKLMKDYFNKDSTYNDQDFEQRFWLRKERMLMIIDNVKASFPYFVQKPVSIFSFSFLHEF